MARNERRNAYPTLTVRKEKMSLIEKECRTTNQSVTNFFNMLVDNYFFKKYGIDVKFPENIDWELVRQRYGIDNLAMVQEVVAKLRPNKIELAQNVVIPKDFKK